MYILILSTHTHTHTHTHIYIYIYVCVCVCVHLLVQINNKQYKFMDVHKKNSKIAVVKSHLK